MKRIALISILLLVVMAVVTIVLFGRRQGPRASGVIPQEAYVWQRQWTPGVKKAVREHGPDFSGLVFLGAEITFHSGQPKVVRAEADYESLRQAGKPVGVALRIGPFSGPFRADDKIASLIADVSSGLIAQARDAGLEVRELQIDFDCPTSKLSGYRVWLEAIRQCAAPVPVTFTALPTWMDSADFASLASAADGFVLQVHWLKRPERVDSPLSLCDPDDARRWVEQASRFDQPFRVALPTYGYIVAFDKAGNFAGISAEQQAISPPPGGSIRYVQADAAAMAGLIQVWKADRPMNLKGVIWYRLPTGDDVLNWKPQTLSAVMSGRVPYPYLRATVHRTAPALWDIQLVNAGQADAPLDGKIVAVKWAGADLLACDALGDFERADELPGEIRFRLRAESCPLPLRPGCKYNVGWLRLSEDREVNANVISNP